MKSNRIDFRPQSPKINNLITQDNNSRNYTILAELGKGAYGTVYKVKLNNSNTTAVLKKINLTHMKPKQQDEALQEAKLLKELKHPNIIKYHDSFIETGNILCILMDFAEGGDLSKLIKLLKEQGKFISEERAIQIFYELASALEYIHSHNIIHRDIKPLNVFLTANQEVKLGDLGVSKILDQEFQMAGTRVGTPLYLAPELVQQQQYDYKVDIWALGCVFYHLIALNPPFYADNLITLGFNIVNKQPKQLPKQFSTGLQEIISKMLNKKPQDRPDIQQTLQYLKYINPANQSYQSLKGINSTNIRHGNNNTSLAENNNPKNNNSSIQNIIPEIYQLSHPFVIPKEIKEPEYNKNEYDLKIPENKNQISAIELKKLIKEETIQNDQQNKQSFLLIQEIQDLEPFDSPKIEPKKKKKREKPAQIQINCEKPYARENPDINQEKIHSNQSRKTDHQENPLLKQKNEKMHLMIRPMSALLTGGKFINDPKQKQDKREQTPNQSVHLQNQLQTRSANCHPLQHFLQQQGIQTNSVAQIPSAGAGIQVVQPIQHNPSLPQNIRPQIEPQEQVKNLNKIRPYSSQTKTSYSRAANNLKVNTQQPFSRPQTSTVRKMEIQEIRQVQQFNLDIYLKNTPAVQVTKKYTLKDLL